MLNIIEINNFNAPELDVYARYTEAQLLNKDRPEDGLFIAESPKVIGRALDAGYIPISVLVEKKQMEEIPAAFEREYDMVKGQIQKLTDELAAAQRRIRIEENKHLREADEHNPNRYTLDGISRFLGKIEYASQTIASLEADGELNGEILKLRERIDKLKKIADEVVAIIAALAATEVEGVASMAGNITNELISRLGMKNLSKGVKVDVLEGVVTVSLTLNLKYNYSVVEVSGKVQEKVKNAIENMTGLKVREVNVRVTGVAAEEE